MCIDIYGEAFLEKKFLYINWSNTTSKQADRSCHIVFLVEVKSSFRTLLLRAFGYLLVIS